MSNKQNDEINEARFEALLDKFLGTYKDPNEASYHAEMAFKENYGTN